MVQIDLGTMRADVDQKYVGFGPNTSSIKPVHIAGGVLRCIYGKYNLTKKIKKIALVSSSKGITPKGNDINSIYDELSIDEKIDAKITKNDLESMRNAMQRLLSVDKGVYVDKNLTDSMVSYSAGSKYFLTNKSFCEDAGEFVGSIIKSFCPDLATHIKGLLDAGKDPITMLFYPVLETNTNMDMGEFESKNQYGDIPVFKNVNDKTQWFIDGIKDSGACLFDNLKYHPNPLTQLRLFNFFCIFSLIRYMTLLEAFYCNEKVRPILLDFSGAPPSYSSVARASEISYMQMHQSISRFYSWGYAKWLDEQGFTKEALLQSDTPVYSKSVKKSKVSKADDDEFVELWNLAKKEVADLNGEEMYIPFGQKMYEMLASKATSNPVAYLRALGNSSGILYPPDHFHPHKRFVVSRDILEMLIRSCLNSSETISGMDIRQRLWNRFGIIIGGSQFEMDILENDMILQTDKDALEENFRSFASELVSMNFADFMADGILQIRLG